MTYFNINIFTPIRLMSLFYFMLMFIFVISTSLIVSISCVLSRDLKHVWEFILLIGFWLTPIVYPETFIPAHHLKYYMLNPLARLISHLRNVIVHNYIDTPEQIMITTILILSFFFLSIQFFSKFSKKIYDNL